MNNLTIGFKQFINNNHKRERVEEMRYTKPKVVDLGASAKGQVNIDSCFVGNGASGGFDCVTGNGAKLYCGTGNSGSASLSGCRSGSVAEYPDGCLTGGVATGYNCASGGSGTPDPDGCKAGPSFV